MQKIIIFIILLSINLSAYSDSDLDGVEDSIDKCPNTPFTDLVDINGCSIKSLINQNHFDIIFGVSYSQTDYKTQEKTDTFSQNIQLDYYYKNFSLQASTSYFQSNSSNYNDRGMNDIFLSTYYNFNPSTNLMLRFGAGIILPTYKSTLNNNKTDYIASINLSYNINNLNLFGGYLYTKINDTDIKTQTNFIEYQDVNSYNMGIGYYITNNIYGSISYNNSESIYKDIEDIKSASLYLFYSFNSRYFSTFTYDYGISSSASNHAFNIKLGYYF